MYERTNFCPYTDQCESFQTILRAEGWMEKALTRLRRQNIQGPPPDGGHSVQALLWRLEHMRRVKERCYSYNGRCLRFWQFKAKDEEEPTLHRRITALLRHEFYGEAVFKPIPNRNLMEKMEG